MRSHKAPGRARSRAASAVRQRGFALLLSVLLLIAGVATVGLTMYRPMPSPDLPGERTGEKFAEVKAALIGYAARQGVFQCSDPGNAAQCAAQLANSPKLGELPCPDTNNDGEAEPACANARLGRVPWKTLGIPNPQDGSGETLWYAVSLRFLNNASNPITTSNGYVATGALNSSTLGDLTVRSADGVAATTTAVAVLFSAGGVVGAQSRDQASAYCAATKTSVQRDRCPSNYLESFGTTDNALGTGAYIRGTAGSGFNDQLVYLLPGELMPALEMRVGAELTALLLQYKYKSDCFCYPWADSWNYSGGIADVGLNRGRLPTSQVQPQGWGIGSIPTFPAWVKNNDWHNQVFYIVAKRATDQGGAICRSCSANLDLTVMQTPAGLSPSESADVALITPGTPLPGVDRPFMPFVAWNYGNPTVANVYASYFEDNLNNNKAACYGNLTEHASNLGGFPLPSQTPPASCDTLVKPQSRALDRDRLWRVSKDPAIICPLAGAALLNQSPCKDNSPDKLKDVCVQLASELKQCSTACAEAGGDMLAVPCANNSSSSHCPGPRAALLACAA